MKLQTVHLRVNDAGTGQPTPVEISITDAAGNSFAPFGYSPEFTARRGEDVGGRYKNASGIWFSISGQCEIALPPGELRLRIRKGLDYAPIEQTVALQAGKMALRFEIERKLPGDGWKQVDGRCHFSPPHAALLDGAAAGLDVVNLLATPLSYLGKGGNSYTSVPHLAAWSGQEPSLERWNTRVYVNTFHSHAALGSLSLLHTHRPVFPLTAGEIDAPTDWTLADWAGQAKRKGGLTVWSDAFRPGKPMAGEGLALAILDENTCFEITPDNISYLPRVLYRLFDAGITRPLIGSSARAANDRPLGSMRTLIECHDDDEWPSGLARGRTVVTNGPRLQFQSDGRRAVASAKSLAPFDRLEIVANGNPVMSAEPSLVNGIYSADIDGSIDRPGWIAVRVIDSKRSLADGVTPTFAHSSPVWIGERTRTPDAEAFVRQELVKLRDWVAEAEFHEGKTREKLMDAIGRADAQLR